MAFAFLMAFSEMLSITFIIFNSLVDVVDDVVDGPASVLLQKVEKNLTLHAQPGEGVVFVGHGLSVLNGWFSRGTWSPMMACRTDHMTLMGVMCVLGNISRMSLLSGFICFSPVLLLACFPLSLLFLLIFNFFYVYFF